MIFWPDATNMGYSSAYFMFFQNWLLANKTTRYANGINGKRHEFETNDCAFVVKQHDIENCLLEIKVVSFCIVF